MNNKGHKLSPEDGAAMEAYLKSISRSDAKDAAPFVIARTDKLPAPGLKPDKAAGKLLYEQSCKHCHDAGIEGLESLAGAKDWLTPVQVMAKVRKLDGWYEKYEGQKYAVASGSASAQTLAELRRALGITVVHAQETGHDEAAEHSEAGEHHEEAEHDEEGEHHEEGEELFPEGSMPFYGTDILSDQQVVDVSFFVAEDM
jgi:mono/diheme cytochrome c family protein